jgi:hypothetical protein
MCSFHVFFQLSESDEENGWVHGDEGDEDMTDGKHSFCISAAGFLHLEHNNYLFFSGIQEAMPSFQMSTQ